MILHRVLIANRGEIAVRILRTCRQLGIESVLAVSDADRNSVAARLADSVIRLGPAAPADSYLSVDAVVAAAQAARADAIHPGYGFLAENPRLARACEAAGITFIGPTAGQLEAVGDKLTARRHAIAAGLPVADGGEVADAAAARALAESIGFPVLVKAVGGGGGRGLRPVLAPETLADSIELAMAEAAAAFGDPRVYLERYLPSGRHVEVQLLGDGERVIHLGDRDCSVQRRYQKLVEEAPAPLLADDLRTAIRQAAVNFGQHLGYRGLGTVEFLVEPARGTFYFLEMNARIQVEHPVTEAVCGLDLVAEQIWVAEGNALRISRQDVALTGHAIECRINAEDWTDGFRPSPGTVTTALFPAGPGVRVDTHVQAGTTIPAWYDSLLAKIVVSGRDRAEALSRLRAALARCEIGGVATTLGLHAKLMQTAAFAAGGVDTTFLDRQLQPEPAAGVRHG
ncbi:MAG: ATP-grasp domain-containing protein [Actinobacteria bacterium]|nr:ATP-grasp domain-containing protein [Actinomycetota bacterium]MBO0831798.1 ATP-grasp domain-containing protein [Actinomycetota bacterium]MBO0834729.1 ATP-grasp domain-containing protein [Actinomycetota bacterium]